MPQRMPAVFFGHGNPMNALLRNPYTEGWAAIGAGIPRPKAILCVSAHWYIQDAAVTVSTAPRTIHDFGAHVPWSNPNVTALHLGSKTHPAGDYFFSGPLLGIAR